LGYGALKSYELVRRYGFGYAPDLILGFFTDSNDLDDDWHYFRRRSGLDTYQHPNLRPADAAFAKGDFYQKLLLVPGSRLNRWAAFRITEGRAQRHQRQRDREYWRSSIGMYLLPGAEAQKEGPKWRQAFALTAAAHQKLGQEAAAAGARYAVVLNNRPPTYRPQAERYLRRLFPELKGQVDWERPAAELKLFLNREGIRWLDLNPTFRERSGAGRTGHYAHDGHWNATGHRWASEALVPFVREQVMQRTGLSASAGRLTS
jgi:hypothetical protein